MSALIQCGGKERSRDFIDMNNLQQLSIFASPLPFSNKQIQAHAIVGSNVREIVDLVCPDRLKVEGIGAIVQINGHYIPEGQWKLVRPKANTVINVKIVPQGGGGGGKNPLTILLTIAILVAAPYAAGAYAAGLGSAMFGGGVLTAGQMAIAGGLIKAAVGIVGALLMSALAPPPKPSSLGSVSNPSESATQFIEGAQNALSPWSVVPICLGTNRMVPPQAARPYVETQDNDQFARQLFCWGYGNKLVISDLRMGETSLEEFDDIELEHRINGDLHNSTTLYSNDVFQENYSVLLKEVDGFTSRTTRAGVDEAIIDITFPQGLSKYDSQGSRNEFKVQLEVQYRLTGSGGAWSPGTSGFTNFSGNSIVANSVVTDAGVKNIIGTNYYIGYRRDLVVIDNYSGVISIIEGTGASTEAAAAEAPILPENKIRLSTVLVKTLKQFSGAGTVTTTIESHTDDRTPSLIGTTIEDSGDFVVSNAGTTLNISGGALSVNDLDIKAAQSESLRRSKRIIFPTTGTYDIRIRRVTTDSSDDQIFDKVYLSAIKSIKHQAPVNLEGLNGTASRIRGTNQLNGTLDQLNGIVSNIIPDYNDGIGGWTNRATSNPASIYRYVEQGLANARPLADSKINIADLEDWHEHCTAQGYSYNRVIDYDTSVDEILRDVAAAGAASPTIVDGKRTIVIDRIKSDIVQIFTPRNSWGYSGEMVYQDMPHAFRVQFRNADKGYQQDERIVYADGYDENNATKFELLELQSCTNSNLAFKTARRHLAAALLRPETHTFMCDIENLVALRGDRIKLEHDVPLVGVGDGRIKSITTSGGNVTGITVDDTISIPTVSTYYVRIRLADGTQLYKQVNTSIGEAKTFLFSVPFPIADTPAVGDLCYFVEAGEELDLIITRIEPQEELTARITGINYAPEIFTAEAATIPSFNSNVTTPLEFIRPLPPVLVNIQSDENVMLKNSDGSFTPRAVITLRNDNEGTVTPTVRIRRSGSSVFTNANVLEATPERVILTGLDDSKNYDIHIRYQRSNGSMLSLPLEINTYKFIGASASPPAVTGFLITVSGDTALLKWDASEAIDHKNWIIKFSKAFSGATWGTAQVLEQEVYENRISVPFQAGTYLIKDVDYLGNESANATAIITYDPGIISNAVEVINEDPTFSGVKDNVGPRDNSIVLIDADLVGYYYFSNSVDLTDVFTSFVSAKIIANGTFVNNLFDVDNIFSMTDVFGSGGNDIIAMSDIFAEDDIFGIGSAAWNVELQYRTTNDDPGGSPIWTDWTVFTATTLEFRSIEFRVKLESFSLNVSPQITSLSITIDMPDRIERGEDLVVTPAGESIAYNPPFQNNPAVVITIQDGDADDEIQYIVKNSSGFTFKVYNTTSATYVSRTYDFISSGYGRKSV